MVLAACTGRQENIDLDKKQTLFDRLPAEETGIRFENTVTVDGDFDVFRYRNFYNGGGVAIGDINNDGLSDVFLTSNMGDNKLFINKGNLKFDDITATAGVAGSKVWSTGVSMVDINADGLLDIYVCNSGDIKGDRRENELFINNGDLTFTDKAAQYGLDDKGFSTHAVFFDFDRDGDLDCYVLNNSFRPIATLGYRNLRSERDAMGGDKLFRNDNGHFVNISEEAGIYGSVIGFGLGISVGDFNSDNWPDLYISNDFYERDYLYINNRNGTFSESLEKYMDHISMFSMGADVADLNNDGLVDIFSTDMKPEDNFRLKTLSSFETYDVYQLRLSNGYYHQFMRNMLQANTGSNGFIELGELAGVASTDWSWGALMTDFNNDGNKEIFVCNGIYKDVTDQDFVEFLGSSDQIKAAIEGKEIDFGHFVDKMTSQKLSNYLFARTAEWSYTNQSHEWGLDEPSFSNGAAYGDLDNDGDLDLIVNNVNQEAFVYRNQTIEMGKGNFLSLAFKSEGLNSFGVGAQVRIYTDKGTIYYDHAPMRGFQSSMDYKLIVGLGEIALVDSMTVTWPDDRLSILTSIPANQHMVLDHKDSQPYVGKELSTHPLFEKHHSRHPVFHQENRFNDFDRDRLIYHMLSTEGPAVAVADLNGDELDDFYLGGSIGFSGTIYIQSATGNFEAYTPEVFQLDSLSEDVDAFFFDADNDRDLDLYVVSGGSEYSLQSQYVLDRLYINQGLTKGRPVFTRSESDALPRLYQSGSCVRASDVDRDGDLDLFVGTRSVPGYYGLPCDQFLLINDGKGKFTDGSNQMAPGFKSLGMVTDAAWTDLDGNGYQDLVVVGEWMAPVIFLNDGKILTRKSIDSLDSLFGWWNVIKSADVDNDGDADFILGNLGTNSSLRPTQEYPIRLYANDFDQNGSVEPVFTFVDKDGIEKPLAFRQDIIKQMSSYKRKFVYYRDYASKSIADIFEAPLLENSTKLKLTESRSIVLLNHSEFRFEALPLPWQAQISPVFAVETDDIDQDGVLDLILGGNLFAVKPEIGRYDAMHGAIFKGSNNGRFGYLSQERTGVEVPGETRHIALLRSSKKKLITFFRNNSTALFFKH